MRTLKKYKNISKDEKTLLDKCSKAIRSIDPAAVVILYGSRARGDAEQLSDYDLLVLSDLYVDIEREDLFRRQLFPIEIETGYVFTIFLYSKNDWNSPLYQAMPFCQNIERDGILL